MTTGRHRDAGYLAGCLQVLLAGLVLSLGVLCIRAADTSDTWQYLFWRSLGFFAVLAIVAAWRHRTSPLVQLARLGPFAKLSIVAMVASQICFIVAIRLGSTAEVFFLASLAPQIAAALAYPILGERIGRLGLLAIAVALGGVALMSGLSVDPAGLHSGLWEGEWLPRALALGTALAFAVYSIAIRGAQAGELEGALVGVGIATALVSALVLAVQGLPLAAAPKDIALGLLHGGIILALGLVLLSRGSRSVPGVTLVMLAQTETVAAPVWTYLVYGETTTVAVMAGGVLILAAVVLQSADGSSGATRPPQ